MNKKTAGISMVALIITIIVLIILTGTVIMTFMEGGIVDRAKEAVFKSDIATYQEILAMKKAEYQLAIATGNTPEYDLERITAEEMKDFMPELKDEYIGIFEVVDGELVLAAGYEEVATTQQIAVLEKVGLIVSAGESEGGNSSNASKITDWEYYINGTDIILTKYIGSDSEVVVPGTYYLAKDTYYYGGNTAGTYNVKIQPNTSAIEWQTTYEMEEDGGLFANNTSITSVEFDTGVKLMGDCWGLIPYMFANCTSLTTVKNLPALYDYCYPPFKNCPSLKEVGIENISLSTDENAVEAHIGYAFNNCGASEVILKVAPDSPYYGETYTVGDTTVIVGSDTEKSNFIEGVEGWEAYISGTDIILTKYIGTSTDVYVPATYYLESDAYYKPIIAGTYNVRIQPNSIIVDGWDPQPDGGLFANNTNIRTVEFEVGVKLIDDCRTTIPFMFYNCTSLTTVINIPEKAGSGDYNAHDATRAATFAGCSSLQEVKFVDDLVIANVSKIFYGCTSTAVTVKVPSSSSYVGQTQTVGDTTLTIVGY